MRRATILSIIITASFTFTYSQDSADLNPKGAQDKAVMLRQPLVSRAESRKLNPAPLPKTPAPSKEKSAKPGSKKETKGREIRKSPSSARSESKGEKANSSLKPKRDTDSKAKSELPSDTGEKSVVASVAEPQDKPSESTAKAEVKKPLLKENESIPFMQKPAAAAPIQSSSGTLWLKTIGAVLLILGLLFVGTWMFKKTGLAGLAAGKSNDSPELKILSSVSPRNGQTISVVRFGERTLLVGSTPQSFTLLADDDTDAAAFGEDSEEMPFDFEGRPVSVSELLAREESDFGEELKKADKRLTLGLGDIG